MSRRLGLGTAPLGGLYEPLCQEIASAVVDTALSAGMTLIDTAPSYGAGSAERRLGFALAGIPRERYALATKVGYLVEDDGGGVYADFSRAGAWRSLRKSLERLRTDRVEIALIHDPDEHARAALTELYPGLLELRRHGVVGAVGLAVNDLRLATRFVREAELDYLLIAGRYTLLRQEAMSELFPLCVEHDVQVILGGIFNSGILAVGARDGARFDYARPPHSVLERVTALEATCARHQVPLHVAALRFALAHPAVDVALIGASSAAEVDAANAALGAALPPALWTELKTAGLIDPASPTPLEGDRIHDCA